MFAIYMQIICTYTCTRMYYNYSSAVLIMTVYILHYIIINC